MSDSCLFKTRHISFCWQLNSVLVIYMLFSGLVSGFCYEVTTGDHFDKIVTLQAAAVAVFGRPVWTKMLSNEWQHFQKAWDRPAVHVVQKATEPLAPNGLMGTEIIISADLSCAAYIHEDLPLSGHQKWGRKWVSCMRLREVHCVPFSIGFFRCRLSCETLYHGPGLPGPCKPGSNGYSIVPVSCDWAPVSILWRWIREISGLLVKHWPGDGFALFAQAQPLPTSPHWIRFRSLKFLLDVVCFWQPGLESVFAMDWVELQLQM